MLSVLSPYMIVMDSMMTTKEIEKKITKKAYRAWIKNLKDTDKFIFADPWNCPIATFLKSHGVIKPIVNTQSVVIPDVGEVFIPTWLINAIDEARALRTVGFPLTKDNLKKGLKTVCSPKKKLG